MFQSNLHIIIGRIIGAHGVKGHVKIMPFTERAENLTCYGPVSLDDGRMLDLKIIGTSKNMLICSAPELNNREAAEAIKGKTISVCREALPEIDNTDIYHADLIGMIVFDMQNNELGKIKAIHNYGAGDIAEMISANGRSEMLPFYPPFLKSIDEHNQKIIIEIDNIEVG